MQASNINTNALVRLSQEELVWVWTAWKNLHCVEGQHWRCNGIHFTRRKWRNRRMITGVIKNKVDKIWTDIWAGGITNPLTVIEQLTYLMFIRSLDEKELETEEFENMTGEKMDKIFPQSAVGQSMRWSKFKNNDPRDIYDVISQRVFPAIKNMKHGHLPDFTAQGELVEKVDDTGSDLQNETAFAR